MLGLTFNDNDWLIYTFNRAIWMWGNWVNNKLAERDKKGKPEHDLTELLNAGSISAYENRLKLIPTSLLMGIVDDHKRHQGIIDR